MLRAALNGELASQLQDAAARAGIYALAALAALVGGGFLTAAGWQAVALAYSPLHASLAAGGAYLIVSLIVLLFARPKKKPKQVEVAPTDLVGVFLAASQAGKSMR